MELTIGMRVKPSEYALRPKRDYWLAQGQYAAKERARQWLNDEAAKRGTVTAILAADPKRGVAAGVEVTWDNGSVSHCLPYRVEAA